MSTNRIPINHRRGCGPVSVSPHRGKREAELRHIRELGKLHARRRREHAIRIAAGAHDASVREITFIDEMFHDGSAETQTSFTGGGAMTEPHYTRGKR